MNVLDPQLSNEPFTEEEDQIILQETSLNHHVNNEETKNEESIQSQQITVDQSCDEINR